MFLNQMLLCEMLHRAADLLLENSGTLSHIDSRFGDGDHGVTISKIARLIAEQADAWSDESIHDFLDRLGEDIMALSGGSAGPLYGTMIGGFSTPLTDEREIDAALLKKMFAASQDAMFELTTARVGDKTMMDALIPAVSAALKAPDDVSEILIAAADAAQEGAKQSEQFVSKFGRAKSYKEQTIGTPDAGAVSTALLFDGFARAVR